MKSPAFILEIKQADIQTAAWLSRQLPEFQNPYGAEAITRRITGVPHLILAAYVNEKPAGFKLGYERDGQFYSWLGGVLPEYRRSGIAKALADEQEKWAAARGYTHVFFKTRNRHKAMLIFALKNGFDVVGFEEKGEVGEGRIWLRKQI